MLALQPFSKIYTKLSYSLDSKWCWWLTIHPVLFNHRSFHFEQKNNDYVYEKKERKIRQGNDSGIKSSNFCPLSIWYRSCLLLIICFLGLIFYFWNSFYHLPQNKSSDVNKTYRISSYSFRGNYSFWILKSKGHSTQGQMSQYINVRKLFKGGNYSGAETIWGNTVLHMGPSI